MKTLFLTIPYYFIKTAHSEFLPPVHLIYLSSFIREKGFESNIEDISADFGIQKDKEEITKFKSQFEKWANKNILDYEIIGLSCYTSFQFLATMDIARICKEVSPKSKIVIGGYHASALPNDFIFEGSPIDYCVIGEGETGMIKILEAEKNGLIINPIVNENPIFNINQFGDLDYSILQDWDKYYYHYDYLSRGCPFGCKFCMESVKTERRWRNLTLDNALIKVESAANHISNWEIKNKNMIMLNDANFGMDKKWLKDLLKGIIKQNYPVSFFASPRIDNLDFEILELMKEAKFTIDISVESGSKEILKLMNKTSNPEKYLFAASELMKHANQIQLPFHTHWIFGYPGETRETINASFKYMQKTHANNQYGMTEIFLFKLYPGSWIYNNWNKAEELGAKWLIPDYWKKEIDIDENEYNIQPSFSMTNEELLRIINTKIKPFGQRINKIAINNHDVCCGALKQKNAPWII